jgi:DNA-directed RNA polymerase specialized sigma24 family protein
VAAQRGEPDNTLAKVYRKAVSWKTPPNWSTHDWANEVRSIIAAAACVAEIEYDASRGVPFTAFLYQRGLARGWTRYRQEWAYALRFRQMDDPRLDEMKVIDPHRGEQGPIEPLQRALMQLAPVDRRLIKKLFWKQFSEIRIARDLKITQQAVSKRKQKIIRKLRQTLLDVRAAILLSAGLFWSEFADSIEVWDWAEPWL